jgi:hypothetical protein
MGKTVHKLFYNKFDANINRVYRLSLDKLSKKCIIIKRGENNVGVF